MSNSHSEHQGVISEVSNNEEIRSAEQWYSLAQEWSTGVNGEIDYWKAKVCFEKAASMGMSAAFCSIAAIYEVGAKAPIKTSKDIAVSQTDAFKAYEEASKRNDPDGHYGLYRCFEEGIGVKIQPAKALTSLYSAAYANHLDAHLILANRAVDRFSGCIDHDLEQYWISRVIKLCTDAAVHSQNPDAQFYLGECARLLNSKLLNHSAVEWYELAALKKHPMASYRLGEHYEHSSPNDIPLAIKYYRVARGGVPFVFGSLNPVLALERCYSRAVDDLLDNDKEAREWYGRSRDCDLVLKVAEWCHKHERSELALDFYTRAALNGCLQSIHWLGRKAYDLENYTEAADWYARAISQNDKSAFYPYAMCFASRPSFRSGTAIAMVWLEKAAKETNDVKAMYELGVCFEKRNTTWTDQQGALKWYERAADLGHTLAFDKVASINQHLKKS